MEQLKTKDNPIELVFDLSYNEREIYPSCFPVHIARWKQRRDIQTQPPRYRYQLYRLFNGQPDETNYFISLYCDILKKEIETIPQLESFFTWMSMSVMQGLLDDTQTTMALWSSTLALTYRQPRITFSTKLRDAHQEFFCEYLQEKGSEIRRKTVQQFVVIPVWSKDLKYSNALWISTGRFVYLDFYRYLSIHKDAMPE